MLDLATINEVNRPYPSKKGFYSLHDRNVLDSLLARVSPQGVQGKHHAEKAWNRRIALLAGQAGLTLKDARIVLEQGYNVTRFEDGSVAVWEVA